MAIFCFVLFQLFELHNEVANDIKVSNGQTWNDLCRK